jgi:hypothetical protein
MCSETLDFNGFPTESEAGVGDDYHDPCNSEGATAKECGPHGGTTMVSFKSTGKMFNPVLTTFLQGYPPAAYKKRTAFCSCLVTTPGTRAANRRGRED